jgi:hypothetical protein
MVLQSFQESHREYSAILTLAKTVAQADELGLLDGAKLWSFRFFCDLRIAQGKPYFFFAF